MSGGTHGKTVDIIAGKYDVTQFFQKGSIKGSIAMADDTNLSDTALRYRPGRHSGSLSLDGLYSDGATEFTDIAEEVFGVAGSTYMVFPTGYSTVGADVAMMRGTWATHKIEVGDDGNVSAAAEVIATSGLEPGRVLHGLTAETATVDTASVNHGAATANGGAAYIAVTTDNFTSATVKVQHSANDSAWSDLLTFSALSVITSERSAVALGTAVNQYLRSSISAFVGTSMTFAVGFCRFPT